MVKSELQCCCSFSKFCAKHFIGVLSVVIAAWAVWQVNAHFQWQNFNALNLRYANLMSTMPEEFARKKFGSFEMLKEQKKLWVRYYFNLTSEEYYLYKRCLIPREMWDERIKPGVRVNLESYPVLIDGFEYWKGEGAFNHPKDFIGVVENIISEVEKKQASPAL